MQQAYGLELTELLFDGDRLRFVLLPPGAKEKRRAVFDGKVDGASVEGTFTQSKRSFPFHMEESAAAPSEPPQPARPQTPSPPFPYPTEDVAYPNEEAGIEIADAGADATGEEEDP